VPMPRPACRQARKEDRSAHKNIAPRPRAQAPYFTYLCALAVISSVNAGEVPELAPAPREPRSSPRHYFGEYNPQLERDIQNLRLIQRPYTPNFGLAANYNSSNNKSIDLQRNAQMLEAVERNRAFTRAVNDQRDSQLEWKLYAVGAGIALGVLRGIYRLLAKA